MLLFQQTPFLVYHLHPQERGRGWLTVQDYLCSRLEMDVKYFVFTFYLLCILYSFPCSLLRSMYNNASSGCVGLTHTYLENGHSVHKHNLAQESRYRDRSDINRKWKRREGEERQDTIITSSVNK